MVKTFVFLQLLVEWCNADYFRQGFQTRRKRFYFLIFNGLRESVRDEGGLAVYKEDAVWQRKETGQLPRPKGKISQDRLSTLVLPVLDIQQYGACRWMLATRERSSPATCWGLWEMSIVMINTEWPQTTGPKLCGLILEDNIPSLVCVFNLVCVSILN